MVTHLLCGTGGQQYKTDRDAEYNAWILLMADDFGLRMMRRPHQPRS